MTALQFSAKLGRRPFSSAPSATWGSSIAALALALAIGLGAVHSYHSFSNPADAEPSMQQDGSGLDGRGKWSGYMEAR